MAKSQLKVKEAVIERTLIKRVHARGGICVKVQVLGLRGFFDRLIVLPNAPFHPRVIFAEVKRPKGGRMSPHQMQWYETFAALGAAVAIVRTLEDIDLLLSPP